VEILVGQLADGSIDIDSNIYDNPKQETPAKRKTPERTVDAAKQVRKNAG
jgi:hypothetical protein